MANSTLTLHGRQIKTSTYQEITLETLNEKMPPKAPTNSYHSSLETLVDLDPDFDPDYIQRSALSNKQTTVSANQRNAHILLGHDFGYMNRDEKSLEMKTIYNHNHESSMQCHKSHGIKSIPSTSQCIHDTKHIPKRPISDERGIRYVQNRFNSVQSKSGIRSLLDAGKGSIKEDNKHLSLTHHKSNVNAIVNNGQFTDDISRHCMEANTSVNVHNLTDEQIRSGNIDTVNYTNHEYLNNCGSAKLSKQTQLLDLEPSSDHLQIITSKSNNTTQSSECITQCDIHVNKTGQKKDNTTPSEEFFTDKNPHAGLNNQQTDFIYEHCCSITQENATNSRLCCKMTHYEVTQPLSVANTQFINSTEIFHEDNLDNVDSASTSLSDISSTHLHWIPFTNNDIVWDNTKLANQKRKTRPQSAYVTMTSSQKRSRVQNSSEPRPHTSQSFFTSRHKTHVTSYNQLTETSNRVTQLLEKVRHEANERRLKRRPNTLEKNNIRGVNSNRRVKSAGAKLCAHPVRLARWRVKARENETEEEAENKRDDANQETPLAHFKRKARAVLTILRVQRTLTALSGEMTTRTAAEMQWYELHVSKEAKKLAFDASLFSRERAVDRIPQWERRILGKSAEERTDEFKRLHAMAVDRIPQWARRILGKSAEERTDYECKRLHAMVRGLKNLDKFTEQIQMAMCRAFQYYSVDSMRVILRKGHIGENFYFIYSGSVFINVEDKTADGKPFVRTECILGIGDSFGEVALLRDCPRGATVTSRESCELLVVDKHVFSRVCPRIFDIELEQKITFVKSLELCSEKHWSDQVVRDMCFEAQIQQYKTNKVIVKDSSKEEWLYIVMKGACRIIKCLWLHDQQDEEIPEEFQEDLTVEFLETIQQSNEEHPNDSRTLKKNSKKQDSHVSFDQQSFMEEKLESRDGFTQNLDNLNKMAHKRKQERRASMDVRRGHLLDSMDLEYVKSSQKTPESTSRDLEKRLPPKARRMSQSGVTSLTSLMREKMREVGGREHEFVYLDIGSLAPGQVFDLSELVSPTSHQLYRRSCLILVSSGSTVFRIRKQHFLSCAGAPAMEHARHLAKKHAYPSNAVLIKSFKDTQQWKGYKQHVLSDTVLNLQHLLRIRNLHGENTEKGLIKASKYDRRVLRRLNQDKSISDFSTNHDAFEEDLQPISSEFESRMLNDADEGDRKRKLTPLIPEVTHRRKSMFGAKFITVKHSSNRSKDFQTDHTSTEYRFQNLAITT